MSGRTRVRSFGDRALLVELADMGAAHRLARAVGDARSAGRRPDVEDVVVGLGSVTVVFDPGTVDRAQLSAWLAETATSDAVEGAALDDVPATPLEIPVRFDGPDLDEVASRTAMTVADVVAQLCGTVLDTAFLGFAPGFAYLRGLPPALAGLERRPRPRPVVPAGSVALAGGFAAVYPQATPGGWHLVGRTGAVLFDPDRPPHALLEPGRSVRFVATDEDPAPPVALSRSALGPAGAGHRTLVVEHGGACTLVEDGGRIGFAAMGVPRAGPADPVAASLANGLVGNAEDEALLEVTLQGPSLRARSAVHVAVVGSPSRLGAVALRVDGRPVPEGSVVPLAEGQLLQVGSCGPAVRAVVAVGGGLRTPALLGSRSSDLLCGLGPAPLAAGDVLVLGPPTRPHGRLQSWPSTADDGVLRVLPGPDAPGGDGLAALVSGEWQVGAESNRVGVRLRRPADDGRSGAWRSGGVAPETPSRGMVCGALQLPPGGEAIVLGPDHATVGGYPVPAVVVAADLHRLAHLAPGDVVRLRVVDEVEADEARDALERAVSGAVRGWFPTQAG